MKRLLLIALVGILGFLLDAQDFHLSQYDAAALNANPGMTGVFKGDYRVTRSFSGLNGKRSLQDHFTTGLISFDANRGKWGWGIQAANFNAGTGSYNVISILPSAAFKIPFGKKKFSFFQYWCSSWNFSKIHKNVCFNFW